MTSFSLSAHAGENPGNVDALASSVTVDPDIVD